MEYPIRARESDVTADGGAQGHVVPLESWESAADAVVAAVAAAAKRDPAALEPLYETIDPDALDALAERTEADVRISFSYGGCSVRIEPGESISAVPSE